MFSIQEDNKDDSYDCFSGWYHKPDPYYAMREKVVHNIGNMKREAIQRQRRSYNQNIRNLQTTLNDDYGSTNLRASLALKPPCENTCDGYVDLPIWNGNVIGTEDPLVFKNRGKYSSFDSARQSRIAGLRPMRVAPFRNSIGVDFVNPSKTNIYQPPGNYNPNPGNDNTTILTPP